MEPEKKKVLKNIKIANDYLELFNNSFEMFDEALNEIKAKGVVLMDKLIIIWSCISFLSKKPSNLWYVSANEWITKIDSTIPPL